MSKLKKLFTLALVALGIAAFAPSALAETVSYVDVDGTVKQVDATIVAASSSRVTWSAGWYAVQGEVALAKGADCSGAVNLILADDASLTISGVENEKAGIGVTGDNNSLTIYGQSAGTGALTVTGGRKAAGIGGSGSFSDGSYITINGGTVTATGGKGEYYYTGGGAGIGGGPQGKGKYITVNGGTVTATGGCGYGSGGEEEGGSGIGGGWGDHGEHLTFNGGTVIAYGAGGSAGIGGGKLGSYITVNGGDITATGGGYGGAGIGGGSGYVGENITVNGGTVKATGGNGGSGIGGGDDCGYGRYIKINGGDITATGGSGASGICHGSGSQNGYDVYAVFGAVVKAGATADPTDEIEHNSSTDLTDLVRGKRYVTALTLPTEPIPSSVGAKNATVKVFTNDVVSANGIVWSNWTAKVVYKADEGCYFRDGRSVVTNKLDTSVNPAVDPDWPGDALLITCTRAELKDGDSTNLVENFTYTAAPATEYGGVFMVNSGATLTGTDVTFEGNETEKNGGAIYNLGTVALTNVTFAANEAKWPGGAIQNYGSVALKDADFTDNTAATSGAISSSGTLSLDGVTFSGNKTTGGPGGAIMTGGTLNFDGVVTLVTTNDTVQNTGTGTLNWNLADGKQGLLNGYDKLINAGGKLQLMVEDYPAMPTNFVIATGNFSNVEGKDTFSITNVAGGAALTAQIDGETAVSTDGLTGYQLVTEEAGATTNLVLNVIEYTCTREVLKMGQSTNLVENFTYTAAPATKFGGVFCLESGATLTGTSVTFEGNETTLGGGAISSFGAIALKDATFTGNKALQGGAIYNFGTLSLDGVTFSGNKATEGPGGAIMTGGTLNFDGVVTLVTTNDTINNQGTLNWNLADGKQGVLNGYQNVTNDGAKAKLQLTVEDFVAMPTNFVIATGDFTEILGKDTFSITNVAGGAALEIKIDGMGVATGTEPGNTLYRLVTEEDAEALTTNLVLQVYEITVERGALNPGDTTNLVEGIYTAAPATKNGGAFYLDEETTLTGTNVTFLANESMQYTAGAIYNFGTVALKDSAFTDNKAPDGGAISNYGTLSLDDVTFEGNKAPTGGAISNGGTTHFDGVVTLKTETDTIYNIGTLNWNLTGGKQGVLNGYQNLSNSYASVDYGYTPVLQLTVEDYATPTNFVIATGDFTDVETMNTDTFVITNVTGEVSATIKIGGLALVDGTWWKLAVQKQPKLTMAAKAPKQPSAAAEDKLVLAILLPEELAKLSNVEIVDTTTEPWTTNATAAVTVEGIEVAPNADGSYTLPKGYAVTLAYTAAEDYMFGPGWTEKTVTLDPLTGDYAMTAADKPAAEPAWADSRTIAVDTRERIVVAVPEEVLPVAYSTNFWGEVKKAETVDVVADGPEESYDIVTDAAVNGWGEWRPESGAYGKYEIAQFWYRWVGSEYIYVAETNANIYYSQPYALTLQQTEGGTIAAEANTADDKAGTVLGYDFVNVTATASEGYVFTGWSLKQGDDEISGSYFPAAGGDVKALETRFEMPCGDAVLSAKFTALTGCEVNGTDIAVGKGDGWEYTPAAEGTMGTLKISGTLEVPRITLTGKLPSHTLVTDDSTKGAQVTELILENFTNDVSDCDAAVALTVPRLAYGQGTVTLKGANYLAAGARESAIAVTVQQNVTFRGTGSLTALPGTAETVLPAINCVLGTCTIIDGTYNNAVDPDLVPKGTSAPYRGAFPNGDGTWSVKQYQQVTFDPVPSGEETEDYWMDANDMTQRVVYGECAIPPAPPKCTNKLFKHWVNTDGQQEYDFSKEVTEDLKLQALYTDSGTALDTFITDFADPELRGYAAGDLSNAVDRVEEGGGIDLQKSGQVCNDIEKQMFIGYKPDCAPTVTVGEGLTVVDSRDNDPSSEHRGNGVIAIGEMTQGADTSRVVVKGELLPEVASVITEKPQEGITKELVEKATNFVGTVSAENLRALPADAMYPMAVDVVQTHGGADAVATRIKLDVVAWDLEPSAKEKGALASVEMEITPIFEVYRIKNGRLETSPVAMYKPSSLQMSGEPATVTFSVAALGQVPKLIVHEPSEGDVECFYHPDDVKPGEKAFAYDPVAKTLSLEMTSFSPVTVYFELDQFAVTLDAGEDGYFGEPGFATRTVYESTVGTGKYRNLVDPTPAKGGDFGGWLYGTTNVANGVKFAADAAHTLTAKWLYEQPVTVVAYIGGMATGSGSYRIGSSVTVAAKPYDNWQFRDWSGYPLAGETRNPATFTMPASPVVLTANFEVSDACRAACADQVMADRDAALAELDALALTDDERAAFAADIDTAAATAIVAIAAAKTPDAAFASVASAEESFAGTLDEAAEVVDGRAVAFAASTYKATEGEALDVAVFGGKVDRTTSVTLDFVKGTYAAKPTVYVDGVKAKFPLALTWARGEVGEKVVTLVTKATKVAEEDRFFTLQLSAPAGIELGEAQVATVTVSDQTGPAPSETDYVRALAWPANGGTASGSGELKLKRSGVCRTLRASAKKYATFAGWYLAKADDANQIDTNALITVEKTLKVGLGTPYGAGTYYAYFVDVLPVASVVDPDETSEEAEGVVYSDGVYRLNVGVPVTLPIGLDDESGKGSLSVSSLPSGLRYNRKEGLIEGTPVKAGVKTVKAVAKNAAGKQTVYYTFDVEPLPANAVGTWNGLVRPLDDGDGTHAGCGSVQFTAASSGKLSAKVTTRLTGTKSFSAKSYERIDENTFGVTMATRKGEVFEATLSLTNDWTEAQLSGTVTGGAFEENGEEVRFTAIRNAFDKKDKNQEALDLLSEYKGEYEEALYLRADGTEAGSVVFVVKDGGKVQVKAKSVNGSYSATCAGAFRITPNERGAVEAAVRSGYKLWAADALLDAETGDAAGLACDYATDGEDTHETIGTPANETEIRIRGLK